MLKGRAKKGKIHTICDKQVVCYNGDQVAHQFVKHFDDFLGTEHPVGDLEANDMFCNKLSEDEARSMVGSISEAEIKSAMFDIDDSKAPGPDGFSSAFFKKAWRIIGNDVCCAIKEFFDNGKLLGEVNATLISLIPKTKTPNTVIDIRPIACCNVLYKCISKIITNRIKPMLNKLVSCNQSAFIPGRKIQDNILLTQEIRKGTIGKMVLRGLLLK